MGWSLFAATLLGLQSWSLYSEVAALGRKQWIIPQLSTQSALWVREGKQLWIYTPEKDSAAQTLTHPAIRAGNRVLRLDRAGIVPQAFAPDILLLSDSPRIHLGRLLSHLNPKVVSADGSNYYSDLDRWATTCSRAGVPFHATVRDGAYISEGTP